MNNKLIKAACLAVATVFAASFAAGCAPDDGGTGNGAPGPRDYHPGYYACFVLDPEGNNIEAVLHDYEG